MDQGQQVAESDFSEEERRGVYRAIQERRDVRSQFVAQPIEPALLGRLLHAAHRAPSVGFMQPWDFILIDSIPLRASIKDSFDRENRKAAANYEGERADLYNSLKLEGILESAVNVCVTCDRSRGGPHVLGRNSVIDSDMFSVCLAVQNLWLAARAEGIGVGWVSILDPDELSRLIGLPESVVPVAYLCLGYVSEFRKIPDLQKHGWRARLPLEQLLHHNRWGSPAADLSELP